MLTMPILTTPAAVANAQVESLQFQPNVVPFRGRAAGRAHVSERGGRSVHRDYW